MLKNVVFKNPKFLEWTDIRRQTIAAFKYASKLKIPHLPQLEPHEGTAVIVGSAPSLPDHIEDIRKLQDGQHTIMSLNGAHAYLINQGIIPNLHVIFECDLEDVETALGGPPHPDVVYYVCSWCHPAIFKQLGNNKRVLWHVYAWMQTYQQAVAKYFPGEFMVGGGHVTFFRTLTIAIILGHRKFELYGLDSSFEETSHLPNYAIADIEKKINIWGVNPRDDSKRKFKTQAGLAFQAHEFLSFCMENQSALKMRVHGDGLLRYLHQARYPEQYQERN